MKKLALFLLLCCAPAFAQYGKLRGPNRKIQPPPVCAPVPDWVVPPVAPAPGETLCWWPITADPVTVTQGDASPPNFMVCSGGAVCTLTVGFTRAGTALPSAIWDPIGNPPITLANITKIYGLVNGDWNGLLGSPTVEITNDAFGTFVNPIQTGFVAWSGQQGRLFSPATGYPDPTIFPFTTAIVRFASFSSLFEGADPPGLSHMTSIGYLIYVTT